MVLNVVAAACVAAFVVVFIVIQRVAIRSADAAAVNIGLPKNLREFFEVNPQSVRIPSMANHSKKVLLCEGVALDEHGFGCAWCFHFFTFVGGGVR